MSDLCIISVQAFYVLVPLSVLRRAIVLLVILGFTVGSSFPVFSGFSFHAVFSGICISDLLAIPKLYSLFQILRLVNSFTVVLTNLLIPTLSLFGLSFAFLGFFGLFLNDLLLHPLQLLSVRVLRTFVGTPFFVFLSQLISHLLRVHSAVQVSFSVFLGLGSHVVFLLSSAAAILVCHHPNNAPHVIIYSVLFLLLFHTSPLAPSAALVLAVALACLTLSSDVAFADSPTAAAFCSLVRSPLVSITSLKFSSLLGDDHHGQKIRLPPTMLVPARTKSSSLVVVRRRQM
ncbi:hypothetical protein MRX96_041848, partial [Rhipicephalus microplus]